MIMSTNISYDNCLKTMYGLRRFGIILGLSTIKTLLRGLGNPQNNFACIHVAGTNGKGSIASALASILYSSGYKVGLYTSPHLVRFNERICINNRPVSDENVVSSYAAINSVSSGDREPTFFELVTAMALYEFNRQKVDWAVIETGMGGRLDATNIINPMLSIISNISIEHKMYLGNTIAEIAAEKGGIIKKNIPVVTGVKQKNAISVIKDIADSKTAALYRLGDAFKVRRNNNNNTFNYLGIDNIWRNMRTGLLGSHQVDNAAIVLAACEILNKNMANLPLTEIRNGLVQNNWQGRLEVVSTDPYILLDGAHNLSAARNLSHFLSKNMAGRKITLVAGILNDKPYAAMLKSLIPVCSRVILTRCKNDRALPPEILYSAAMKIMSNIEPDNKPDIEIIPDVGQAVMHAVKTAAVEDVICIAGSLYVAGEAKEALDRNKKNKP